MIDRVIQALATYTCAPQTDHNGKTWWLVSAGKVLESKNRDYEVARAECARLNASAVLLAMREPTEAMSEIGNHYTHCGGSCGNRAGRDTWQAMIDAALTEKT